METRADLESNEVVADRRGNTPDWVWSPPETAYHETYVELLLDTPNGMRRVAGIYRKGPFWGKEVEGWFAPERISENGQPGHSMYIGGFIKGWRPYRYHLEGTRPTADLGEDGELVAEARLADDCHQMLTCDPRAVLALRDRLTLYGEALADAQEQVGAYGYSTVHGRRVRQSWAAELLDKIDAVLSRSGG